MKKKSIQEFNKKSYIKRGDSLSELGDSWLTTLFLRSAVLGLEGRVSRINFVNSCRQVSYTKFLTRKFSAVVRIFYRNQMFRFSPQLALTCL